MKRKVFAEDEKKLLKKHDDFLFSSRFLLKLKPISV